MKKMLLNINNIRSENKISSSKKVMTCVEEHALIVQVSYDCRVSPSLLHYTHNTIVYSPPSAEDEGLKCIDFVDNYTCI